VSGLGNIIIKDWSVWSHTGASADLLQVNNRLRQEIAERQRVEEALRESEARYRTLVEQAPEAIVVFDVAQGHFIDLNENAVQLFGLPRQELLQTGPVSMSPPVQPDGRPSAEVAWEKIRAAVEGNIPVFEWTHRNAQGQDIPCEIRLVRLPASARVLIRGSVTDISARKKAEALQAGQQRVLEMIALNTPLSETLDQLVRVLEAQSTGMLCSVLLLDEDGLHMRHGAAPHLPPAYTALVDGICIGPRVGSCGTAMFTGQPVAVTDISTDPLWADYYQLAAPFGLRACWATPIRSRQGQVLGSFAMYYREPRSPTPAESQLVDIATHIAGIAIERQRAAETLQRHLTLLQAVMEGTTDAVFVKDQGSHYLLMNSAGARMVGRTPREVIGKDDTALFDAASAQRIMAEDREIMAQGHPRTVEETLHLAGVARTFHTTKAPHRQEDGQIIGIVGISRETTEIKRLEEQFRQAQKMEAIGRLASGIAHDFNNVLHAIQGYGGLLLTDLGPDHPLRHDAEEILKATERAASLTRQLLTFSRPQRTQRRSLNLNNLLRNMENMLRRLLGAHIRWQAELAPDVWQVHADPGQIEQIVMNLSVNAMDAMPDGGQLTITTANVQVATGQARAHPGIQPGNFVRLTVTDTGCGMDQETLAHIFEPFFTTKEAGKGTGLGLATVYGIAQQSGGFLEVTSTLSS
jgi:PAS domain S-box-containing protein